MHQHEVEVGKCVLERVHDAHGAEHARRSASLVTTSQRRSKSALFAFALGTVTRAESARELLNDACVGGTLIANSFGFS
jgi:hypothetical protein